MPRIRSGGNETVIVVQDTPTKIVLQHILVDGKNGHVIKHWRQDWTFEAPQRFEFSADQTWTVRALAPAETTGAWTQCVYEVSDAPRYCGTGRWTYDHDTDQSGGVEHEDVLADLRRRRHRGIAAVARVTEANRVVGFDPR